MFGFGKKPTGPAWPTKIVGRRAKRELYLEFDSGESGAIDAELLRVNSPSAEVKGHGAGPGILVTGKKNVSIDQLEPVGNYAVRILFNDGHSTGLYTWDFLLDMLRTRKEKRKAYEKRLKEED